MSQPTAESIRGRATGTFFFTGFGALWVITGLHAMHRLSPSALSVLCACACALLAAGLFLMRRAAYLPSAATNPEEWARTKRVFNAVNIIQWVAVATAVVVLNLLQLQAYIVPAIAIIVGLHLYPLAGAFRYPVHYITGTALIAWSIVCMALLDRTRIPGIGAFGTGCLLLCSSAVTLLLAFSATRSASARTLAAQS